MAKDTEKLIRQLSLISLMANRRPVSALEIKREVEGYSSMNEDAFARLLLRRSRGAREPRHRAPGREAGGGLLRGRALRPAPENYYLPAIAFSDSELAALRTALGLLDGEFAYAAAAVGPAAGLGEREPAAEEAEALIDVKLSTAGGGATLAATGEDRDRDLASQDVEFSYYSLQRDEVSSQGQPYHLVFRDRASSTSSACTSAIRCGFGSPGSGPRSPMRPRPSTTSRRPRTSIAATTAGARTGRWARSSAAKIFLRERIAWLVERDFGRHGSASRRRATASRSRLVFETDYASARQLISWVLSWRENARLLDRLAADADERAGAAARRHRRVRGRRDGSPTARGGQRQPGAELERPLGVGDSPRRFARLVSSPAC